MRAFMGYGRDQTRLLVAPAQIANSSGLRRRGPAAIAGHHQRGIEAKPVLQHHLGPERVPVHTNGPGRGEMCDIFIIDRGQQGAAQDVILDDPPERGDTGLDRIEPEPAGGDRPIDPVGHLDPRNRLCVRCHALPKAKCRQQVPRPRRDRICPSVKLQCRPIRHRCGINQRHGHPVARQRDGHGHPDQPAAQNRNIISLRAHGLYYWDGAGECPWQQTAAGTADRGTRWTIGA